MMASLSAWISAPTGERRDLRIFTLTAFGLLSGVICATHPFPDSVSEEVPIGIVFGIIVGGALWWMRQARPLQVLAFIVASEVCWLIAFYFARDVTYELVGERHWYSWLLIGILSGLLGAATLGLCCRVLFPFFRSWQLLAWTIVVGGLTGAVMSAENLFVLFSLWQAGFALCLGIGVVLSNEQREDQI